MLSQRVSLAFSRGTVTNKHYKATNGWKVSTSAPVSQRSSVRALSTIGGRTIKGYSSTHTNAIKYKPRFFNRSFTLSATHRGIIQQKLADIGEGIDEVEVLKWFVKEGDTIQEYDALCDVQSDKATAQITSMQNGKVVKIHYEQGNIARVGTPLCDIEVEGEGTQPAEEAAETSNTATPTSESSPDTPNMMSTINTSTGQRQVAATPAVRALAFKNKINLSEIVGTGKDGRVLKGDVLAFIAGEQPTQASTPKPTASKPLTPSAVAPPPPAAEDTVVPLRGFAKAMAPAMQQSLSIPHFGYDEEVEVDALMALRKQLKDVVKERGAKLTYMPFIIKATSLALKEYPLLNSQISADLTQVTYKAAHNISFAVASPTGLVVPVIKNVQNMTVFQISKEMMRLQEAAANNALSAADLSGGTFSLSNIGVIGGTYTSPVIVAPQVCIGAIGRIQKLPRYNHKDELVPKHIFRISWACDHRVLDGVTIANFTELWKQYLEKPATMILDTQ